MWRENEKERQRKTPVYFLQTRLYKKWKNLSWEIFQPLFIVPKHTLMSFIYYKRSKKEKLQFWRKIPKVGTHKVILAYPAKICHTLPKFGIPYETDDFALRNALFSSILLPIVLATPCQVWQGVLKCSKAHILHVDWSSTCFDITCTKLSLNLSLFQWSKSYQKH